MTVAVLALRVMHLNKLSWFLGVGLVFASAFGALGCEDEKKPPKTVDDATGGVTAPNPTPPPDDGEDDGKSETKSPVSVGEKVAKMCDLKEPRFDFDSARLSGKARGTLDAIVTCFKTGPGKGHNLHIVGHTDERGEPQYNFALGQKRAGAVENYMKGAGLGGDRIESSSEGELGATGTDAAGWARDRRVDILLAE